EKKNNIILQQENKLSRQQMWGVILVGSALLIILTLTWIGKNAQQKNKLLVKEKENAVYYAINEGEERERKRLAGELHDGIASNLVALKLKLENSHPFDFVAEDLLPLVTKTHEEIRHAAHNLSPLNFEQQTLASALRTFASECSHDRCAVLFQTNQEGETKHLPKHIALIIYRVVQELVQNALKHARASAISVQLLYQKDELWITVEDDGQGFDTAVIDHKHRNGLNNLIYRLEKIGGSVDIESQPNIGTTIFIHLKNLNT
ncbi:MAG TPA: ATP-binding protein, partial [Chitinophagaceae bacterium]|nr:ATP-binding protein [Chitinophagaceae bacterium]